MAKIGTYPNAATLTGTEQLIGVQSAASVNLTPNQLKQLIRNTIYINTTYQSVAGDSISADSSAGAFTITLPLTPTANQTVSVFDCGGAAAVQNITVARNGETINGVAEDFVMDQNFGQAKFVYDGTTWKHSLVGSPEFVVGSGTALEAEIDARVEAVSAMVLLGTATVSGSAAQTMTVSGLDLSAYKAFRVIGKVENATGSEIGLSMYYNADTTATNYHRQVLLVNGTAIDGIRANDAAIAAVGPNDFLDFNADITSDLAGKPRATAMAADDQATDIFLWSAAHIWITAANVTSITISGATASSLAIGSTFSVYGIR